MQYYGQNLSASTNDGYPGSQDYNFNSPWKVIASVAGVIGSKFIISADYEWNGYKTMKFSKPTIIMEVADTGMILGITIIIP